MMPEGWIHACLRACPRLLYLGLSEVKSGIAHIVALRIINNTCQTMCSAFRAMGDHDRSRSPRKFWFVKLQGRSPVRIWEDDLKEPKQVFEILEKVKGTDRFGRGRGEYINLMCFKRYYHSKTGRYVMQYRTTATCCECWVA